VNINSLPMVEYSNRSALPRCQAVYFVLDAAKQPLYVGKTTWLRRRWQNHHRKHSFAELGAAWIAWLQTDDIDAIEMAMIAELNPPINGSGPAEHQPRLLNFLIELELLKRVDDFRFKHRFQTRAAAIKWLLDWAMNQKPVPKE